MPALLTHLVLKADHLSSFLRLLKSDPTAGFNVKSIEFPLEVNRRESVLEVVPIPAVYCARVEHPSLDNLDPKFKRIMVKLKQTSVDNAVKLPFQTLIEGLSNSRSSLKHLDCFGLGLAENAGGEDPADFSSLTVLESICIDSQVVFTWSEYFKVTFPPKLQCLQLYNNDTLLAGSFTPENAISAFLLNHKLNPGFELKTYREIVARNMEGSYRAPPMQEMNRKSWQRCRNELVKECRDLKVKLTLMELEE